MDKLTIRLIGLVPVIILTFRFLYDMNVVKTSTNKKIALKHFKASGAMVLISIITLAAIVIGTE